MAFTADEIQSLNDILEKKLTAHRREIEHVFDQRIQTLRRELERRLQMLQQEMILSLTQKQAEQQKNLQTSLGQKLHTQQQNITQAVDLELKWRQSQVESLVDRALAAQLLAIEESLSRRLPARSLDETAAQVGEHPPRFEAIEVQTDLSWEDLSDIFGKVLDERLVRLNEITQASMRDWEQYFSVQLQAMQTQLQEGTLHSRPIQSYSGSLTSMQEVFQSIEQLERLIESMQVAMTSNHALLSNRLYHHQQLPLERTHSKVHPPATSTHPNGTNTSTPLSLPEERLGK